MVTVKNYSPPCLRRGEILRYAGAVGSDRELDGLIDECSKELLDGVRCSVCYDEFVISLSDGCVNLGDMAIRAEKFAKYIEGCDSAVVFCATIGLQVDRLIARYGRVSPARALMIDAIGSELVEGLCDKFYCELMSDGRRYLPRFSPGYGDLPLELQRDVFSMLDCQRRIGVTLGDSLLMTPSKSVTAIVGILKQ